MQSSKLTMKTILIILIVIMIILSLVVRINFNDTDNSLYGAELIAPITMIKNGEFTLLQVIEWILLLIAHFVIFCLPFLTGRKYFKTLLLYAPLCFIIIYILYASIFILILLIPFIFFWIITLIVNSQIRTHNNDIVS